MKIIVGLGNPGLKYKATRHNAGFLLIKALADKNRIKVKKKGFKGIYGVGRIRQREVMLFKPLTYMNLSGEALCALCSSKLEKIQDLLVISDDFNLPLGHIRFRERGSAGGHNGLQSIIDRIGPDFARLRIGVGREDFISDMSAYVLSAFSRAERNVLRGVLEKAGEAIELWLSADIKNVMSRYNS